MNHTELERRLEEQGCNSDLYAIGSAGGLDDGYCLWRENFAWRVCYCERGVCRETLFESRNEGEACEFFCRQMMSIRHDHCVGFFRSSSRANELFAHLQEQGLEPLRDQIPYGGSHDPRYRVFVVGRAIFDARKLLGEVPLRD